MVRVVDVFPTVADIAGIDLGDRVVDGVSLLGNVADPEAPSARTHLYTQRMVPTGAPPWDLYDGQTLRDARHNSSSSPTEPTCTRCPSATSTRCRIACSSACPPRACA